MKRTELKRRTALTARTPLVAHKPLQRGSGTLRRAVKPLRQKHSRAGIPADVVLAVLDRSGGDCEACGAFGASHLHHRKLRSQGGRHEVVNLLHLHPLCHETVHAHPDRSYALGLLVHGWADPADVPVVPLALRGVA